MTWVSCPRAGGWRRRGTLGITVDVPLPPDKGHIFTQHTQDHALSNWLHDNKHGHMSLVLSTPQRNKGKNQLLSQFGKQSLYHKLHNRTKSAVNVREIS